MKKSTKSRLTEKQIRESFKQNPEHEQDIAKFMANHVYKKYGGDFNKMSWSWLNGHNTTNFPENFKNHYYVERFNKNIEKVRKPAEVDAKRFSPQPNTIESPEQ